MPAEDFQGRPQKEQHAELLLNASRLQYVMWSGYIVAAARLPGDTLRGPTHPVSFHARMLYNLISSKGRPFKSCVGSSLLFFPSSTRDLTPVQTLFAVAYVQHAPVL